jgi:ribosomal protein S18 acetylase RimI-like enzyme
MASAAAIADLLNAAYAKARALPRVVPQPFEMPVLTEADIAAGLLDEQDRRGLFTVEQRGRVVALVFVRPYMQTDAEIVAFATHPDCRRQGLGSKCLQDALQYLREGGRKCMQTSTFIDSRVTSACTFLEHHGFTVRNPDGQNIVMQFDMDRYEPQPVELPDGYRIASLRLDRLQDWIAVKDGVFESTTTPDWFMTTFGNRPDFDPTGWHILYCGDEPVGIAGADLFRDPARPQHYSGCQIEYVGVLDTHRGKRLGEMLMRTCLNYTKHHGVQPCQLITQPFRQGAVPLYEKLGFRLVRENRIYERSL